MGDWALNSFAMEIQTVGAESNDRTIIAELNRGLLEGRPTGTTGNIEIASISTTWLEKSIQTALALVPQTERAKALLSTARVIRTLRDEMKKNNWHNAKAALVEAESLVHISKRAHTNLTALKAKKISHLQPYRRLDSIQSMTYGPAPGTGQDPRSKNGVQRKGRLGSVVEISRKTDNDTLLYGNEVSSSGEEEEEDDDSYHKPIRKRREHLEKLKQLKQKEDNQIDSAGQHIAAAELELVRHEVNNMDIVRSLSGALECGMAITNPLTGKIDINTIDILPISQALEELNSMVGQSLWKDVRRSIHSESPLMNLISKSSNNGDKLRTRKARHLARTANIVLRLRQSLLHNNWEAVELALNEAKRVRVEKVQLGRKNSYMSTINNTMNTTEEIRVSSGMNVNTLNDSKNTVATTTPFSGLDNVAIAEVTQIQDVSDDRRIVMTLTESLSKGYAEGHVVGEMNPMTIDTVDLDYAITSAKKVKCKTTEAKSMLATAVVVLSVRKAWRSQHLHDDVSLRELKSVLTAHVRMEDKSTRIRTRGPWSNNEQKTKRNTFSTFQNEEQEDHAHHHTEHHHSEHRQMNRLINVDIDGLSSNRLFANDDRTRRNRRDTDMGIKERRTTVLKKEKKNEEKEEKNKTDDDNLDTSSSHLNTVYNTFPLASVA